MLYRYRHNLELCYDLVKEVPVFGLRMFLGGLKFVTLPKDGICDEQVMLHTFAEEENTIGGYISHPFFAYSAAPELGVPSDSNIEISQEDEFVCLRCGCEDCIESTIKLLLSSS